MFEPLQIRVRAEIGKLPFRVRPVMPGEHDQVYQLRHQAYADRALYLDGFKQALLEPDSVDANPYATTFVAVCKHTSEILGTIRIACNADVDDLLPPETPSDPCVEGPFAFIDRFAVKRGAPAAVSLAVMKAVWLWTIGRDARWMVALAGAPLARRYQRWAGMSIRADGQSFIVAKDLAAPVFLVAGRVGEAQNQLIEKNPGFVDGFLSKVHPDINVMGFGARV